MGRVASGEPNQEAGVSPGEAGSIMSLGSKEDRWEAELRALREELTEMRAEQREMAKAIGELVTTFRTLAAHLGIAAEPYGKKTSTRDVHDLPGFG